MSIKFDSSLTNAIFQEFKKLKPLGESNMEINVRFAPSPTGKVHIGNIRTAIFNWLFARHNNGEFLLRIEDTDRERSTNEAIQTLLDSMEWIGLNYDGKITFQSEMLKHHLKAVDELIKSNNAYKIKDKEDSPVFFRIPPDFENLNCIKKIGLKTIKLHPNSELIIDYTGVRYFVSSRKGKAIEEKSSLAGFKDMCISDKNSSELFKLEDKLNSVINEKKKETITVDEASQITYTQHEVVFEDLIKGKLGKPLENIKDFIILRTDGSPVFHIANVCDDAMQNITHIIRGDDHIENTFRHVLLFEKLGLKTPLYAHLPMIVNKQGKPYSKRDGDAFLSDFISRGFLPEALFNYMTLLGWSPGDNREKMKKNEIIEAFTIDRVQSSPAKFDSKKLNNLNSKYIAELESSSFIEKLSEFAQRHGHTDFVETPNFLPVAELMQSRTRNFGDLLNWKYFFTENFEYDRKALKKAFKNDENLKALANFAEKAEKSDYTDPVEIERLIRNTEKENKLPEGKLNFPLRISATGTRGGADIAETLSIIGMKNVSVRIKNSISQMS